MKIHILHDIREGPYGGGNQFLKSLRDCFRRDGVYEESARRADVILFNSHQKLGEALSLKRRDPDKVFVHRVDGPVSAIRDSHERIDGMIYRANRVLADGTVFQTDWSRERNRALGMPPARFETVIMNAPDPRLFHLGEGGSRDSSRRLRLVATSWSSHPNKGFDAYEWLDEHLDFARFEMTFIGRSPVTFRNIRMIDPLPSPALAERLREQDVFVTASRRDPCSNALIEALHCGLPAVALNDGGHPEIVGRGGELFDRPEEIPDRLERIQSRYEAYRAAIRLPDMEAAAASYRAFLRRVREARDRGVCETKPLTAGGWAWEQGGVLKWTVLRRVEGLKDRWSRLRGGGS